MQIPTIRQILDEAVKEAEASRRRIQSLAGSDDTDEKPGYFEKQRKRSTTCGSSATLR